MLNYIIRKAKSIENSPTIVLIHGYGSNAEDLFSFKPYLPDNYNIIAIQAPLTLSYNSYAWYPLYPKNDGTFDSKPDEAWGAVNLLEKNLDHLVDKYKLNKKDICLLGFSQGSILSWALAYSRANKVRRIVALSGFVHESVDTSSKPTFLAYAAHGKTDMIIPISKARNSILQLSKKYSQIEFYEFPEGHTVSQENMNLFLKWLKKTDL